MLQHFIIHFFKRSFSKLKIRGNKLCRSSILVHFRASNLHLCAIGKSFGSLFLLLSHLWFLHIFTVIGHEFWLYLLLKIWDSRQAQWGVKFVEKSVCYYLSNVFLWKGRRKPKARMISRNQCQRLWEWLVCGHIHGGNILSLVSEHHTKINLPMAHCQ